MRYSLRCETTGCAWSGHATAERWAVEACSDHAAENPGHAPVWRKRPPTGSDGPRTIGAMFNFGRPAAEPEPDEPEQEEYMDDVDRAYLRARANGWAD